MDSTASFCQALSLLDVGAVEQLAAVLQAEPALAVARQSSDTEPQFAYCVGPTLLHLVANNPNRMAAMPPRILESTRVLLAARAEVDAPTLDPGGATPLALVASSGPAQVSGIQVALLEVLVAHGADPARGLAAAIHERCPQAANALLRLGAAPTLLSAAGLGDAAELVRLLPSATPLARLEAAAAAVAQGHEHCLTVLLDAGLALDAPVPRHPYCPTLLHQAGSFGQTAVARLLLSRGADPTLRDSRYAGTPADWAREGGHQALAAELEAASQRWVQP
jgi:hypothetical protein